MKTIELLISGQKAQFTTRSVTFDGKEYLYSHITKLDHSPVVRTYRFEYDDGDTKLLTYEKKDAKLLAAIFSQVHKMVEMKKAKAAEQSEAPAKAEEPAKVEEPTKTEAPAETANVEEESPKAEIQEDTKAEVAEPEAEAAEEKEPVDPEKQARIKKSFKIFGIVIAAVIAAAIIYYFVFGTSHAPTETNPNITESQQYEDIDQLIDDLQ